MSFIGLALVASVRVLHEVEEDRVIVAWVGLRCEGELRLAQVGAIAAYSLMADPSPMRRVYRNSSRPVGVMTWKA
jgi:hypothetical protein